jgi:hypothetical protein
MMRNWQEHGQFMLNNADRGDLEDPLTEEGSDLGLEGGSSDRKGSITRTRHGKTQVNKSLALRAKSTMGALSHPVGSCHGPRISGIVMFSILDCMSQSSAGLHLPWMDFLAMRMVAALAAMEIDCGAASPASFNTKKPLAGSVCGGNFHSRCNNLHSLVRVHPAGSAICQMQLRVAMARRIVDGGEQGGCSRGLNDGFRSVNPLF